MGTIHVTIDASGSENDAVALRKALEKIPVLKGQNVVVQYTSDATGG